jgi:hypothetical protein
MANVDAVRLLQDSLAMYQRVSSYQDEGVVSMGSPGLEGDNAVTFETLFVRPSLFRFKFSSPHPYQPLAHIVTTTICGLDQAGAYMWSKHYDAPARLQDYESIEMAVAGATGISSGSAHNIGQLLFDEIGGARFTQLEGLSFSDSAIVGGVLCKSVHGQVPGTDAALTLFIEPETLIIPRIDTRFAQFSSQETRRNIRVDARIELSRLARPNGEI